MFRATKHADGGELVVRLSAARTGRKAEAVLRTASRRRRLTRLVRTTKTQNTRTFSPAQASAATGDFPVGGAWRTLSGRQYLDRTSLSHDHQTQIPRKALIPRLINRLRVAQHDQFMIGNTLMIGRMAMRPGIRAKPHGFIKAQTLMGNLAGQRIDFENGQRRTLKYFS
ncbi:Uncharacterised protein [Klebsiella oxytoca]|nr:Uncharacterised protein [Klebsiella oxytoca]